MLSTKLLPRVRTITTLAPTCTSIVPLSSSLLLDSYCQPNPQLNIYSSNRTIDDFVKSGHLNSAKKLFDEMPARDMVTYNLLISGCGKFGHPKQALYLYDEMVSHGIDPFYRFLTRARLRIIQKENYMRWRKMKSFHKTYSAPSLIVTGFRHQPCS